MKTFDKFLIGIIGIILLAMVAGLIVRNGRIQKENTNLQTQILLGQEGKDILVPDEQVQPEKEAPKPVYKKPTPTPDQYGRTISEGCQVVSFCNGPIECMNADIDTSGMAGTCEWREEYTCYTESYNTCSIQNNGQCAWEMNEELTMCIDSKEEIYVGMSLPAQEVVYGQEERIAKGQSLRLENTDFVISVSEFSNNACPVDVQCVWSGVGIFFDYFYDGSNESTTLEYRDDMEVQTVLEMGGHKVQLVDTDLQTHATLRFIEV